MMKELKAKANQGGRPSKDTRQTRNTKSSEFENPWANHVGGRFADDRMQSDYGPKPVDQVGGD